MTIYQTAVVKLGLPLIDHDVLIVGAALVDSLRAELAQLSLEVSSDFALYADGLREGHTVFQPPFVSSRLGWIAGQLEAHTEGFINALAVRGGADLVKRFRSALLEETRALRCDKRDHLNHEQDPRADRHPRQR